MLHGGDYILRCIDGETTEYAYEYPGLRAKNVLHKFFVTAAREVARNNKQRRQGLTVTLEKVSDSGEVMFDGSPATDVVCEWSVEDRARYKVRRGWRATLDTAGHSPWVHRFL